MHNQHVGLSQQLTAQRITERHEQATHQWPFHAPHPRRRWRPSRAPRWE
jgi:hypothetical protein